MAGENAPKTAEDIILAEICSEIKRKAVMRLKNRHGHEIVLSDDQINKECRMTAKQFCYNVFDNMDMN